MNTEASFSKAQGKAPNSRLPLLVHRNAISSDSTEEVKGSSRRSGWGRNCAYPGVLHSAYAHPTRHDCHGRTQGRMEFYLPVAAGGWTKAREEAGDTIMLPFGGSREYAGAYEDTMLCGGYAGRCDWDTAQDALLTDKLFYQAPKTIMSVSIRDLDPATGNFVHTWPDAPSSLDCGWNDGRGGLDASS